MRTRDVIVHVIIRLGVGDFLYVLNRNETRRDVITHVTLPGSTIPVDHCKSLAYIFCRWMYGSKFIQFCAVASKRRIFSAPECVLAVQGRSGSSKVDDFRTNRKRVYDFLLVRHCDYGPILRCF